MAISFCAIILPSPSAMVSIAVSVFARFGPLQPPMWAAWAGTTAYATAAIAAALINLLSMVISHLLIFVNKNRRHCRNLQNDFSLIVECLQNEFRAIEM